MRLVLVGPPGAGKGTQAEYIADYFSITRLSTGDIFRANVSGDTELGKMAKKFMDEGDLVPDVITNAMVRDGLSQPELADGFLLDGFPRNVAQAYELDSILNDLGSRVDVALQLIVDTEEVVRRLSGRRMCRTCGHIWHVDFDPTTVPGICDKDGGPLFQRDDDQPATVRHRIDVYAEQTSPLVAFYAGRHQLVGIDAIGAVEDVTERAIAALKPFAS